MAKGINVEITAGGGGTPATYSLSRQIDGGGYSVINGAIAYTASPQTYQDNNGGSGFSDGAVIDYKSTATNTDGTSAESSVAQHTVSGGGSTYTPITLTPSSANPPVEAPAGTYTGNAGAGSLASLGWDETGFTGDFKYKIDVESNQASYMFGIIKDQTALAAFTSVSIGMRRSTSTTFNILIDGSTGTLDNPFTALNQPGDEVIMERIGTTFTIHYNTTLVHTLTSITGTYFANIWMDDGSIIKDPQRVG